MSQRCEFKSRPSQLLQLTSAVVYICIMLEIRPSWLFEDCFVLEWRSLQIVRVSGQSCVRRVSLYRRYIQYIVIQHLSNSLTIRSYYKIMTFSFPKSGSDSIIFNSCFIRSR